jgi:hypothetical protein
MELEDTVLVPSEAVLAQPEDLATLGEITITTPFNRELGIPVVTTTRGLTIANFSSPHPFNFNDGTTLEACSVERAKVMAINSAEVKIENESLDGIPFTDIVLTWEMSEIVKTELNRLERLLGFDILIVPLAVMSAIKGYGLPIRRARVIRTASERGAETRLNYADRFCI